MARSNKLFWLIKAMDAGEKRYFRLNSGLKKREKNYLLLFNLIEKQVNYNEAAIIKKLNGKKFTNALHVTKNYLYYLILRSLRNYREKTSPKLQLRNLLSEAEILRLKGLPEQAYSLVNKGLKLAEKYHMTSEKCELLQEKLSLILAYYPKEVEKQISETTNVLRVSTQQLEEQNYLYTESIIWSLITRKRELYLFSRKNITDSWNAKKSMFTNPLSLSFKAKTYFWNISTYEESLKCNFKKQHFAGEKIFTLWQSEKKMIDFEPHVFLIYTNNYLTTCGKIGKWEVFPKVLKILKQLPIKNFNQAGEAFQVIAFKELYYMINTHQFENAEKSVAYIDEGMKKYKAKIHDARRLTFYYNLSILFFMQEKYNEALERILCIINHPKTEHRLDLQRLAYLFELIYHYELGNMLLVSSMSVSLGRRLLRMGKLSKFEKTVLRHLKALSKAADKTEKMKIYEIFKSELDEIAATNKSNLLGVEELQIWLDKKLK